MFCVKCGASFPKGTRFCTNCGRAVASVAGVAAIPTLAAAAKPKSNPFLALVFLILIASIAVSSYLTVTNPNRIRFDIMIWMIRVFEVITFLFIITTLIPLTFKGFKKYVLPKLRQPRAGWRRILSALQRKFFRHK